MLVFQKNFAHIEDRCDRAGITVKWLLEAVDEINLYLPDDWRMTRSKNNFLIQIVAGPLPKLMGHTFRVKNTKEDEEEILHIIDTVLKKDHFVADDLRAVTKGERGRVKKDFKAEHFEKLLRGVERLGEELDGELQPMLDRPVSQLDQMEKVVLRIGAFELLHCPELPFRVVIDECVDLANRFGSEQGHAYVNAVLDKAARQWRVHETGDSAKT